MFKGMKSLVAAAGVAGVIAGASAAQAANVRFDVTGQGGTGSNGWAEVTDLDFNHGNAVAVNAVNSAIGESFDVYFQSSVSVLNTTTFPVPGASGTGGPGGGLYYITARAKFSEQKSNETVGANAQFEEGSGSGEYFELWISTTAPNALTGAGFGNTDVDSNGTLLLRSTNIVLSSSGANGFDIDNSDPTLFDNVGADNYGGLLSVIGDGSTNIDVLFNTPDAYINSNFFAGLDANSVISAILSRPIYVDTPFNTVNPSQAFYDATTDTWYNPDLGNVNGLAAALGGTGQDIQFQTNGGAIFQTTTPVIPEPATAAMGLFGLAGLAMAARRRR